MWRKLLQRITRKEKKRNLPEPGPMYHCSRVGINRLARERFKCITSTSMETGMGVFSVRVTFKWWAGLIPFYRRNKARKLGRMVDKLKPAGIKFHGVVW